MKIFNLTILVLLFGLLFIGGLGIAGGTTGYLGLASGVVILIFVFWKSRKIIIPRGLSLYLIFLIFFLMSILWSHWKGHVLQNFILYLSGGIFWVGFYNLGGKIKKNFSYLILALGVIFGGLFLIELARPGGITFKPYTIYLFNTISKNHNHLGDLWAVVLTIVAYQIIRKSRLWFMALVLPGIYFLGISLSRSAYVALLTGIVYMFWSFDWIEKYKRVFLGLIILIIGFFLYSGVNKSVLYSRPYFEQAIVGLYKHPFGVGVGNFSEISTDPSITGGITGHYSSLAHNVILEIISGMGILGVSFIIWLGYVLYGRFKHPGTKNVLFSAIFLAITANFMFDTTYYIPTILWLWFVSLGLAQAGSKNGE